METVTIPKHEYIEMQIKTNEFTKKLALLQDQEFLSKLELAYHFFIQVKNQSPTNDQSVSIKRGSAKQIITYIADDFTAPFCWTGFATPFVITFSERRVGRTTAKPSIPQLIGTIIILLSILWWVSLRSTHPTLSMSF